MRAIPVMGAAEGFLEDEVEEVEELEFKERTCASALVLLVSSTGEGDAANL